MRDYKEVIVLASKWEMAQKATNLIYSALVLIEGDSMADILSAQPPIAHSRDDKQLTGLRAPRRPMTNEYYLSTPEIPNACLLAVRAGARRHLAYAITKYHVSCQIYSIPYVDLEPFRTPNIRLSPFHNDHVRFATSIILAYSVIEELGLEIRASQSRPSRLESGEWNPKVRSDLEYRLIKARIDIHEDITWLSRGPSTNVERIRPVKSRFKSSWSEGAVRDSEVELVEAIARASWLRSKVSSHAFTELAKSLSPYDVANVQSVARRLLLSVLRFC